MAVLATDNFTRADNADLGTLWDPNTAETGSTGFKIASNRAVPKDLTADCSETYNGVTWPADHYSEWTFGSTAADGAGTGCGPTCREATAAVTMYRAVGNASGYELVQLVAGVSTQLSVGTGTTFTGGDKLKLEIRTAGANVAWVLKKNGVQFASGTDTSPIAGPGRASIGHSSASSVATGSGWEGGNFLEGGALPPRDQIALNPGGIPMGSLSLAPDKAPSLGPVRWQNWEAYPWGAAAASKDIASTGVLSLTGSGSLTAIGTVAAAGTLTITGAALLRATGTVASAGTLVITATASMTSTGTLASAGTLVINGAASLTAQGTLAASGTLVINGAAALTGLGSLASAGTAVINGAADLTSTSANDIASAGSIVITSSAALSALGSLASSGALVITGAALLDDGAIVVVTTPSGGGGGSLGGKWEERSTALRTVRHKRKREPIPDEIVTYTYPPSIEPIHIGPVDISKLAESLVTAPSAHWANELLSDQRLRTSIGEDARRLADLEREEHEAIAALLIMLDEDET